MRSHAVVAALLTVGSAAPVAVSPAAASVPVAAPVPAAAVPGQEDGLETRSKATYVVDPGAKAIRVTVETTVTNEIPNRTRGGVIEQAYFSEIGVPILAEAANFAATKAGGGNLPVTPQDIGNPHVKSALIDLQPNLFYGQSQTIKLTYDLPNQRPRSPGVSRANDAFVTFPVFAFGDSGLTSVEVRLPERYEVEVVGADLEQTESDGQTVLTAANIQDPDAFMAFIVGTDDEKLVSKATEADGAPVEVRAWPDDAEWADFAAEQVAEAKPALEELIGQPWPSDDELVIVETASPYAYGYAGWYDEADHTISVGDELDPRVMVHELSHVWFNSRMFADRWIAEGFAEEYATTALEETGQEGAPAGNPDRRAEGALPLNDWSDPFLLDETSEATEKYGYATAWYVIDQIAAEVGPENLREVLAVIAEQDITYAGDPEPESMAGSADWRRLLDLLEDRAGSTKAAELWDAYVVDEDGRALLVQRAEARVAYDALVERGGTWTPPLEVRRNMAQWRFDSIEDSVGEANAVLDLQEDIDAALEGLDVDHLALEDAYESAGATDKILPDAEDTLTAAEAYAHASERFDEGAGLLGTVGMLWSGTDDRLDDARRELEGGEPDASLRASAAVERSLDNATRDGAVRLGGLGAVGAVGAFGGLRVRRWRKRRRTGRGKPPEGGKGSGGTEPPEHPEGSESAKPPAGSQGSEGAEPPEGTKPPEAPGGSGGTGPAADAASGEDVKPAGLSPLSPLTARTRWGDDITDRLSRRRRRD